MNLDYANRGNVVVIPGIILTVFALLVVIFRLHTRVFVSKGAGWDDALIGFATAVVIVNLAFDIVAVHHGYGRHVQTLLVTGPDPAVALKYQIFSEAASMVGMMAIKASIGVSFLRLRLEKMINIIIYVTITIALLCNLCALTVILGQCHPIARAWNLSVVGTCWSNDVKAITWYVQSAGNIASDIVFALGPLVYISRVKLSNYNKWALRMVFGLALLATACGIVKIFELKKLLLSEDPTWDTVDLTVWYMAEMNVGIFAASLPALKARFEAFLFHLFGIRAGNSYQITDSGPGYTASRMGRSRKGRAGTGIYAMNTVEGNANGSEQAYTMEMEDDRGSDKHILGNQKDQGGIFRTVEYIVADERFAGSRP